MDCNWQQAGWLDFLYETAGLTDLMLKFADHAGHVGGFLEGLPEELGA